MLFGEAAARQRPGTDYADLKSLVTTATTETRSNAQLSAEESAILQAYLKYKTTQPHERRPYQAGDFKLHRHGFVHLPALCGTAGIELDHSSLLGRLDEIEDVIVKGDRLWCVFTVRARHVGRLYRQSATNRDLAITEMCCLRYADGKLAEAWFLGDELSICRQIGIQVNVPRLSQNASSIAAPSLTAGPAPTASSVAALQMPGTDYGALNSLVNLRAAESRSDADLSDEERRNLDCFLRLKGGEGSGRRAAGYRLDRPSRVHLPEFHGADDLAQTALDDRSDEIEDLIVKGDRLWSVSTLRARHSALLYGVPPTGQMIEMLEYSVMRFADGKIAEEWRFADELGLCRQLGIPIAIAAA